MHRPALVATLALHLTACAGKPAPGPAPSASASAPGPIPAFTARPDDPPGDAERGKALVAAFECHRCHEGTGLAAPPMDQQCFGCHVKILEGTFRGPKGAEARWLGRVVGLDQVPTLQSTQQRFRRAFLTRFLLDPVDLRPSLGPTMPRLAITPEQARDIATYLAGPGDAAPFDLAGADPARGRTLLEQRGCGACHAFTGVPPLPGAPAARPDPKQLTPAMALAPDLRFTRDRLRPEALVTWISSPKKVKADALMPDFDLPPADARDIAAYILGAPLAPPSARPVPPRLPVLERRVTYDEVSEKVFRRTCWHCHGEADYAKGDGGPGNTGGLGFKGRRINFVDYGSVQAGMVDDKGEFHSLFEKVDGVPRLVRSLLVRQQEEAGRPDPQMKGMPMGFPSLAPEEIQLVETWAAQGRPR